MINEEFNNNELNNENVNNALEQIKQRDEEIDIENMHIQIETLEKERDDFKNRYLYLLAEFDNYKKRTSNEKESLLKYKEESLLKDLITVYEQFNKALEYNTDEGVMLIFNSLKSVLSKYEFVPMNVTPGAQFNVDFMEAISILSTSDPEQNNTIANVLHDGYIYKNKVVKYAQVVVYQN